MRELWKAGFGEVTTESSVDGPMSFRFTVTYAGRSWVFCGCGQLANALYNCGEPVSWDMGSEAALALVVRGAERGDYVSANWHLWGELDRFDDCNSLAHRLISVTRHAWSYPDHPDWHPSWRTDGLAAGKLVTDVVAVA